MLGVAGLVLGGGLALIPGLLLLGFALARLNVPQLLDDNLHLPARALLILVPASLAAGVWAWVNGGSVPSHRRRLRRDHHGRHVGDPGPGSHGHPLRGLLTTAFAPLGRMALTNYLAATAILLLLAPADKHNQLLLAFATVVAMLSVQWLFSLLWTRHVGQGPLEKLSRLITWGPVRHNGNHDRAVDLQRVP